MPSLATSGRTLRARGGRALHVPLGELAAAALAVEADHPAVVVDRGDRAAGTLGVGARADGDRHVAVDGDGPVGAGIGSGLVARRGARVLAVAEPGGDDRVATGDRVVVGVVPIGDVLAEERLDRGAVVGLPGVEV